ncbi:TPA: signal recognition particle-docking protein FtsY [Legionella pneumophila]|uniref:Signal recognition particle receptor FtsY n=2 Tax=Legionella pneumophila TaxID=446 RepID=A0A2S6EVA7_LEGPN|nr:signal recognition particle-docking protein FtsY [Legionella pneumophila]TIH02801.1 signal recognition particle-docking protein FtsY [Legionella pneumophila]CZG87628.1 Cell division protein FtsY [Legionella pneumophila]CZH21249.1 Cell division protein FtsY [Legionella pneumophila]HAT6810046.1 signal recognition particle-docking protein FtsY [Legionella pneumophila]
MIEFHIFKELYTKMIKWFKRNQNSESSLDTEEQQAHAENSVESGLEEPREAIVKEPSPKESIFARFKKGLSKTRHQLGEGISRLLLGKKEISQELLEELETLLISADLGLDTTQEVLKQLNEGLARKQLSNGEAVYQTLKANLQKILSQEENPLSIETEDGSPFVILMVGVNGAGKTTTIGKLAKQFQKQGKKVMLAAGDTFRAAAVEQLHVWGERNGIPVIAQHTGADSASVIFDALQAAKARKIDVLIADTAGRLHTQSNLMEELKKVKRVMQKLDPKAPHETMLVLDASIGQNALAQAKQFHEAVQLTGITMTKLDGTAKGGILFAIANDLGIPFRYLGVGEGIEDLRPFDAAQFVSAIFDDDHI